MPSPNATRHFSIRLREFEREALHRAAAKRGQSAAAFIREAALAADLESAIGRDRARARARA